MAHPFFSRQNLDFTLFEVLNVNELTTFDSFSAFDAETFSFTLDTATDIAEKIMRPAYVDSDRKQPELTDGNVRVHEGVHNFVKTFGEAGFIAAPFSEQYGGIGLPKTIAAAGEFILGSAHNSFVMYTDLTKGAANLIYTFGTDTQKQFYLSKMLTGEWLGTMCLTETQAGSSLSDVVTSAAPQSDGTYKIKGQKIFISAGDHDITDNIVHLVIARIDGAPKGTKGISLFIVPKKRNAEYAENSLVSNDVTSIGIYHKMGQKATPAMHLEFGAHDDCIGYLLGEPNRGLPQMFLMMNNARLGVGLGGIQVASAAYYASLQYAKERPQGRRLNEKSALGAPATIIHHPDVRRMLLSQKATVEGGLSFILQCYKYLDLEKACKDNPEQKQHYNQLLELLTPVAKTYGAEAGFSAVNQGLQVFGGYGYTEDFMLEQMLRDVRIMSLYEGTTGIQSQALLGRQVVGNQGKSLALWYKEVRKEVLAAESSDTLKPYHKILMAEIHHFQKVTNYLIQIANAGDAEVFLADANCYMEAFSILNIAWQWLKQGMVASGIAKEAISTHSLTSHNFRAAADDKKPAQETAVLENSNMDTVFHASKIQTMQYFFHYEVPKLKGLFTRLMDDTRLTIFDEGKEILM